jgi:1,4-dihydroxy-2-naphthoate octaprenyltransferase
VASSLGKPPGGPFPLASHALATCSCSCSSGWRGVRHYVQAHSLPISAVIAAVPQAADTAILVVCSTATSRPTVAMWAAGQWPAWGLLSLLSLPLAVSLARGLARAADGPSFNRLLAGKARLALVFCVLFSIGLALR